MQIYQLKEVRLNDDRTTIVGTYKNYGRAIGNAIICHEKLQKERREGIKEKGVFYNFIVEEIEVIE